jgi:hypothetical protein
MGTMSPAVPVAGLAAALLVLTSCSSTPEASLEPDVLTRALCGLHHQQRDLSGLELASDDEQNALWQAQVDLSTHLSPEIAEGIDRADFSVRDLLVGNEPDEENVEEGRSQVDDACADVDEVEPDAALLAGIGCLFVAEGGEVWTDGQDLVAAAGVLDDGDADLAEAAEADDSEPLVDACADR